VGPWPPGREATAAIERVAQQHGPRATRLLVYFGEERTDLVQGMIHFAGPTARCSVEFVGPLPDLDEEDVAHLIARGASVMQSAGWPIGAEPDLERIQRICELGLRVPVVWYVHRDNIGGLAAAADEILQAAYHSGVAFEPVCAHPQFTENDLEYVPAVDDYIDFLVEAYRRFRHFDDVFEPLRSLVHILRQGGWDPQAGRALPVRIRIDEGGDCREFRQLPWSRAPHRPEWQPEGAAAVSEICGSCRWLPICGGCEAASPDVFELVCEYRMLYLEFFLREMHQARTEGAL
jgi:hypothetical protein